MSATALLPIVGVAAAAAIREAASAVGSGLSFAAELVRQGRAGEAQPPSGQTDTPAAGEQFSAALAQFVRRLKEHLSAAGLAISGRLELRADGLGGIGVGSEHPQSSEIESVLTADDALRDEFAALAEGYTLLEGGSRHEFGLLVRGDQAEVMNSKP